ncbi:hypothetical protein HMPREF1148_1920 [Selenomonas sp. FOBRC6]|nr:hypothetical protein HMPREF1148_1920 [Selenomonas sp. FOBRC6]
MYGSCRCLSSHRYQPFPFISIQYKQLRPYGTHICINSLHRLKIPAKELPCA